MIHVNATLECSECGTIGYCRLLYQPGTHQGHTLSLPSFVVKDQPAGWIHGEHLDFCSKYCESSYFSIENFTV